MADLALASRGESAIVTADALPVGTLEGWMRDIRYQPAWRARADVEDDYYDSNQIDAKTLAEMRSKGIPEVFANLIAPTVDTVLGMEAKARTDWKVTADGDDSDEMAEAMNEKLHEAERTSNADRAISDAYAPQIKTGLGWVEVGREHNPFADSRYRLKAIHRREIWWDWLAKEPDISDARWLVRKRWTDEDIALLMFPKHEQLIKATIGRWQSFTDVFMEMDSASNTLASHWSVERSTTIEQHEYLDLERRRVCVYEVWYRKWVRGYVLRTRDGLVVELDKKNPFHKQAIAAGLATVESAIFPKMRLSWWIGPHRLADIPTPYPHNDFPYVPFFGKRENRTGAPYGMIRAMISPQDEFNARRQKIMWLLSAKRVTADEDAVLDHNAAAAEVARPDAYIKLNKNRLNKTSTAFQVDSDMQLNTQQFEVMLDAAQRIQDSSGVFHEALGKSVSGGATSGIAINSLVEQSTTNLAEINDNTRHARTKVGNLLLSLIKEDIGRAETSVMVGKRTPKQRRVVLNSMTAGKDGAMLRTNDVQRTKSRVELEDVPSTPTYRQQQLLQLTELTKALPPEIQALVIPMVIESTDLKQRHDIADLIRSRLGIQKPIEAMTPEERQQAQEQIDKLAKDDAFQEEMKALALAEAKAKMRKAEAEATLADAKTEKTLAETASIEQDNEHATDDHALNVAERVTTLNQPPESSEGKS